MKTSQAFMHVVYINPFLLLDQNSIGKKNQVFYFFDSSVFNTMFDTQQPKNREGNGNPFQYSRLDNPMDGGDWQAAVHGVTRSQTQLSNFTFTFHFHALEKEMATTLVFLPGESQGWRTLVGCRLWGHTESDMTEPTQQQQQPKERLSFF